MKKLLLPILILGIYLLLPNISYAYTVEDVTQHNTEDDCWMIYGNGVYDLTNYLDDHDRYLDIKSWCGEDITEAFETKDGINQDHKSSSYALLEEFRLGDIEIINTNEVAIEEESSLVSENTEDKVIDITDKEDSNPYNLFIPLLLSLFMYWGSYYIYGKSNLKKFNGFWNTILFLTLIIPSFGFGMFMILRYSFSNLWNISFDFMYWHVELSIAMGVLGISHLIQRWKVYILQLRKGK